MVQTKGKKTKLANAIGLSLAAVILSAAGTTASAEESKRVIVAFKAGASANAKAAVARARGQIKREISGVNAIAAEVPVSSIAALQSDANVDYVEEDVLRYLPEMETTSDEMSTELSTAANPASDKSFFSGQRIPYGIAMVQADQLPNGGAKAGNRKICIIDSGYDGKHEDLNHGGTVTGEYDSGTGWWYTDENSHGTHVAGTVAALNNPGTGVVGVIPTQQLRLHIVKVFGKDGWAYSSELSDAANKCAAAGANVISMSLSGPSPSATEQQVFDALYAKGILSVAAASNQGTTNVRYPAGYASVISVGALDQNKQWATFSNYNDKVELSAPGVGVLSTIPMNTGVESLLSVGGVSYAPGAMTGSPLGAVTAPLADFGLGTAVNPAMAGKVCLISRGVIPFSTKVLNCQNSGGVAAIVYNNNNGGSFGGTLGGVATTIPSVTASAAEGAAMLAQVGQNATVTVRPTSYAFFNGTSMATPHVSAVAALVWSYYPMCTAAQIRNTLVKSAMDLGDPGRDPKFGHGMVQAKAAYDRLKTFGCNN
ncbi:MAG TPA: S8 family serine peptidase [Paucimonas sp.]|nr:S8 family serine peptidase [Paucimonas sp.]